MESETRKELKSVTGEEAIVPFGAEFLEELPFIDGVYGAQSQPTSVCSGLQTGGGDDPLSESSCS